MRAALTGCEALNYDIRAVICGAAVVMRRLIRSRESGGGSYANHRANRNPTILCSAIIHDISAPCLSLIGQFVAVNSWLLRPTHSHTVYFYALKSVKLVYLAATRERHSAECTDKCSYN